MNISKAEIESLQALGVEFYTCDPEAWEQLKQLGDLLPTKIEIEKVIEELKSEIATEDTAQEPVDSSWLDWYSKKAEDVYGKDTHGNTDKE